MTTRLERRAKDWREQDAGKRGIVLATLFRESSGIGAGPAWMALHALALAADVESKRKPTTRTAARKAAARKAAARAKAARKTRAREKAVAR